MLVLRFPTIDAQHIKGRASLLWQPVQAETACPPTCSLLRLPSAEMCHCSSSRVSCSSTVGSEGWEVIAVGNYESLTVYFHVQSVQVRLGSWVLLGAF